MNPRKISPRRSESTAWLFLVGLERFGTLLLPWMAIAGGAILVMMLLSSCTISFGLPQDSALGFLEQLAIQQGREIFDEEAQLSVACPGARMPPATTSRRRR